MNDVTASRDAIAREFGINQQDAELLLTAPDDGTLRLQAERWSQLLSEQGQRTSNVAPAEGAPNVTYSKDYVNSQDVREFIGDLFASDRSGLESL